MFGGPRLYRFYNYEQDLYFPAPVKGWNPDANPWELPADEAPVLDNFIIRPGKIQIRGAMSNWADLSAIAPIFLSGIQPIPVSLSLLIGRKSTSATAVVDHQFAPIVRPSSAGSLASGNTTLQVAQGGTTLSTISATLDQVPGPRGIDFEGVRYYLSAYSAGAAVQDSASSYFVKPVSLNTLTAGQTITTFTNAPHGALDIAAYQSRIWLLAGIDTPGAGTTFSPNTLFFTNPGASGLGDAITGTITGSATNGSASVTGLAAGTVAVQPVGTKANVTVGTYTGVLTFTSSTTGTLAPVFAGTTGAVTFSIQGDWQDPTSGATNRITIDGNTVDPCTGLATVRNALLVFRYRSIYLLRGSTTANYTLLPLSRDVGCFDARSLVETDQGVYFMSKRGLMLTNGSTVKNVSGTAMRTLQTAVAVVLTSIKGGNGGYATSAITSDGQILVTLGIPSVTAGVIDGHWQTVWCGMYDPTSGAWTRVTSALFTSDTVVIVSGNNYPAWAVNFNSRLLTIGDKYITQLEAETSVVQNPVIAGPNLPAAGANVTSTGQVWSNPGFIVAEDGNNADTIMNSGTPASTDYLVSSQHGFNIPANATITGILLEVKRNGASTNISDAAIRLVKAGTIQTTDKSAGGTWPVFLTWTSYGGSADLWGTTWSPSDINNSGFGGALRAQWPGGAGNGHPKVDAFRITVYYTIGAPTAPQSFVQTSGLYDKDASGNFQPIPAVWQTPIAPLVGATLRRQGIMKRYFIDHVFQGNSLPSTNGWTFAYTDVSNGPLATQSVAPTNSSLTSSSVSGGPLRQAVTIERQSFDDGHEVQDPQFTVSWVDAQQSSQPAGVVAELYGVGYEFQKTRDRR